MYAHAGAGGCCKYDPVAERSSWRFSSVELSPGGPRLRCLPYRQERDQV